MVDPNIPAENAYTTKTWFQLKCDDPETGYLWIKARILCTCNSHTITALYLFDSHTTHTERRQTRDLSQRSVWSSHVHTGIRILFDRIVTRWKPAYLSQTGRLTTNTLHESLTPEDLHYVPQIFDNAPHEFIFDIRTAQGYYEQCFVPLLYHELWEGIKHDSKGSPSNEYHIDGNIVIEITEYEHQTTQSADGNRLPTPTALIHGSYSFNLDRLFNKTIPKLGLCDIVLIYTGSQHNRRSFFGVVVHAVFLWPADMENNIDRNLNNYIDRESIIAVDSKIILYVSEECLNAVKKHCGKLKPQNISLVKVSNLTSSRRHISAIYNLSSLPEEKLRSLLKPSNTDPYFHHELLSNAQVAASGTFNIAQMRVINYAEQIFNDNTEDRLHLVHGPPGTGKSKTIAGIVVRLLPKLGQNGKILLCAPSNNACDELSKRILDQLDSKYPTGTLVRVGRVAPFDNHVCEHFLESLTMKKLVEDMQDGGSVTYATADSIKEKILSEAKVIVSTLNYSANNTLLTIKKQKSVKFIIIDEACQSLEADCLLPFYFGCYKIILVGDPKQLPPCVLSTLGQKHNLSQSLYSRLDSQIHEENISLLTMQYRMHKEICRFPSAYFYQDQLQTDDSTMDYLPDYPLKPYYLYNLVYTRHTCPPNGGSSDNEEERKFIKVFCIKLLERLVGRYPYVKNDKEFIEIEKRIVVITPYKKQMTRFRDKSLEFPRHIEVITVDSAQGKEKDIVLISCVRSGGTIGFLADEHRLNVMLTRARRALYIFGNLGQLAEQNTHWNALVDDAVGRQVIDTVFIAGQVPNLPD